MTPVEMRLLSPERGLVPGVCQGRVLLAVTGSFMTDKAPLGPSLSRAASAAAARRVSSEAWECDSSIDLYSSGGLLTRY